jgi:Protein of unknown function (DUF2637)
MWERLPQHLRAGLVLSVIALIGAAAGGFLLSFVALREVAGNHITGWTDYAWVFPVTTDFGLVACEVTFLTLSMMRGTGLQQIVVGFFMLVFGAFTIYFNTSRIPADMAQWRMVTGAPPAFGIVLTLIFAILLKAFVRHIGKDWAVSGGNEQVGDRGVVRGYIERDVPEVETSSGPRSNGSLPRRPARVQALAKSGYGAKRMRVQDYLAKNGTGENPGKVARKLGVSERYVKDIMREQG